MAIDAEKQLCGLQRAQGLLEDDFRVAQALAKEHDVDAGTPKELETAIAQKIQELLAAQPSESSAVTPQESDAPVHQILHQGIQRDYVRLPLGSFVADLPRSLCESLILQVLQRTRKSELQKIAGQNGPAAADPTEHLRSAIVHALNMENLSILDGIHLSCGVRPFLSPARRKLGIYTSHTRLIHHTSGPLALEVFFNKNDRPSRAQNEDALTNNCGIYIHITDLYTNERRSSYFLPTDYHSSYDPQALRGFIFGGQRYAFAPEALAARLEAIAAEPGMERYRPARISAEEDTQRQQQRHSILATFINSEDLVTQTRAMKADREWEQYEGSFSLARLPGGEGFERLMREIPWEEELALMQADIDTLLQYRESSQTLDRLVATRKSVAIITAGFRGAGR